MVESDEDNERDNDYESQINLAGFLFGNIDENGQLEDDILDSSAKEHLSSLCHLGLGSLLSELISQESQERKKHCESKAAKDEGDKEDGNSCENVDEERDENGNEENNFLEKSPSALDFSDINELADDCFEDQDISESKVESKKEKDCIGYEADDESTKSDSFLMPPPLPVASSTSNKENIAIKEVEKKYETPLASMLPSKYANVDVTELFPDFRPNKVLRFSKLFGPVKPNNLPPIWRSARKRRKKKKQLDLKDSDSGSEQENRRPKFMGWEMNYGPEPSSEECETDEEIKLLTQVEDQAEVDNIGEINHNIMGPKVADWRFGPAQIWYDNLKVSETGEGFNYGFKLKEKNNNEDKSVYENDNKGEFDDDAFLMVSQLHWEDDVIWNGDDIKHKMRYKLNNKNNAAGWVPSSDNRTAQAFSQPSKGATGISSNPNIRLPASQLNTQAQKNKLLNLKRPQQDNYDNTWYSIFPVENEELVYGIWEKEVIWDAQNMESIPKPKILTLDPNDENIILGIPEDVDPSLLHKENMPQPKVKIPHPHVKKSKLLLGKAGVINVLEEDAPPPPPKSPDRDPFNISNDIYYLPRSSESTVKLTVSGGNLIQHSTPVVELRAPFIQTHIGPMRLRNFHRPTLKRYSHGTMAQPVAHTVLPLLKTIKKKAKQREQERIASGGGDVFFMRTPEDLTGCDGEMILIEFSEEHPPLINQVGMCSKVKNYYKRTVGKDQGPPKYRYGETAYAHTSPFLGILTPGQSIQAVENNMYRAPIYEHQISETDFLVIRTRNSYFIREVDALFVAGQQCPLYEVPGPNSKRANNFVRDFLQVFIYRLFWKSRDTPRRIRMDEIKKAFPLHSESSIRKRLKLCADFKRTGLDSNWWVIKNNFRLPTEEEIRAMVSPEQCCAYFSMIAAGQRLKDAGYGEKFLFTPQDDDDEEMQLKMDDEVKVAPWNTTRAYIQTMRGKCLLQLTGPADPTGCGEGFSYVRVPNKPTISKEEQEAQPKRTVTGTDADLRRLSLSNAKALLRKFGVPEEEIKKLSRWEVIDVVRTLSTEKAKAGEEGMTKFSRGNRFSIAEHQERYKEECQRIFDLQNRVLSSQEVLSTDEGESSAEEDSSDIEEMGKNIENMLSNKKTSSQLTLEREEQQRQELRRMMIMNDLQDPEKKSAKESKRKDDEDENNGGSVNAQSTRILKIHRTYRDEEGKEFTRVEFVRKPAVIDTYLKIRNSKDESFIKQFTTLDEAQKEEIKREKRRLQEQLRRLKRNQDKERMLLANNTAGNSQSQSLLINSNNTSNVPASAMSDISNPASNNNSLSINNTLTPKSSKYINESLSCSFKRKKIKLKPDLKLKCGACGQVGHMRTNKACPLYLGGTGPPTPVNANAFDDQEEEIERLPPAVSIEDENLVNVDGTKVTISTKLMKQAEEAKRALVLKVSKDAIPARKRKRLAGEEYCDYLKRPQQRSNRVRTDPLVKFSSMLDNITKFLKELPDVQLFLKPVQAKDAPDYHNFVIKPMDLQTIRDNIRKKKYQSREEFLTDVNQIVENSSLYNGPNAPITESARRMLEACIQQLRDQEEELMKLEKTINPLLDDNDQVALSYILDNVVNNKLKLMSESRLFQKPVNRKLVKDYYNIVTTPMDLETISKKIAAHKYHNRSEFVKDVEQIVKNCEIYNGEASNFTAEAKAVLKVCNETLLEYNDHITQLERKIALVQEKAYVDFDSSSWPGVEEENYTFAENEYNREWPNTPLPPTEKQNIEDFDFVDIEGDLDAEPTDIVNDKKKDVLEEDLQFSSEDEFDEVPFEDEKDKEQIIVDQLEIAEMNSMKILPENDNQQVAEAMVQLSNVGYYVGQEQVVQEESMDVDPNYDPSEMFMAGFSSREDKGEVKIQDDLAVSDSDEDDNKSNIKTEIQAQQIEEDIAGDLWF